MTYAELDRKLTGRCKNSRKLENNTYAQRRGDSIAIKLHGTDIIRFHPDDTVTVSTGGYWTVTTKERLNEYLPWRVWSHEGDWYIITNPRVLNAPYDRDQVPPPQVVGEQESFTDAPMHLVAKPRKLPSRAAQLRERLKQQVPFSHTIHLDLLTGQEVGEPVLGLEYREYISQYTGDSYWPKCWQVDSGKECGKFLRRDGCPVHGLIPLPGDDAL